MVMELLPQKGVEVASPLIKYNTHERGYDFSWFNTVVRLYGDEYDSYAKYFNDGQELKVPLPDGLQAELLDEKFPFSYFPTRALERNWYNPQGISDSYRIEQYEPMAVEHPSGETHSLYWNNTVIRVFGEDNYNHIEVRAYDDELKVYEIRGMFVNPHVMRHLFENDYPIIFLPSVEMDGATKKWFEAQCGGELHKD